MEDWDVDQQRRPATTRPVHPAAIVMAVAVIVLLAVWIGVVLRAGRSESPLAVPAGTGTSRAEQIGGGQSADPARDAAMERAVEMLRGDALDTGDPNALNLSPAQTLVLHNRDSEVQVTPGKISAGTGPCAAGPLLTVTISVRVIRGSAELGLGDFALLAGDRSVTHAVEACSSGFVEAARERTIVFAAAQPGQLTYGPDPDHPVALWHLT